MTAILAGCASPHAAWGRWSTPDDAEWSTESMQVEVEVHDDGTATIESESVNKILREGARSRSTYHVVYNSRAGEFKVLEAETVNGETHIPVEREFIEDKPQASPERGFDQFNQVSIAFPKATIGSVLRLRNRRTIKEVPFAGHYSQRFDFGNGWLDRNERVHVVSELPLFADVHDPDGKLEVVQKKTGDTRYETTITLKAPIYTSVIDEPWISINPKHWTFVVLSSTKTYPELAEKLAASYEDVLNSKLPPLYERILEHARAKSKMVDRLNTITSELATEVRYLGDWRPVKGGHIPRPLEVVATTRFGDCKDFSAATAAILRKLGVRAQVAWVERSAQPEPLPAIAYEGAFNHAIVWLEAEGREWWIDPTNFASFAQGTFADVMDRQALVVEPGHSRLGRIPVAGPEQSKRQSYGRVNLEPSGDATIDAELSYAGRAAEGFAGATLRQSKDHVDHFLITSLVDESRLKWHEIGDYDLSSRVTKDFGLHLKWGESMYSMRTTVGPAFYLGSSEVEALLRVDTKKRVSDLFLGQPDTVRSVDVFEHVHALGRRAPSCALDSPWLAVSRKVEQTPAGLKITDERIVKKSLITNEEIRGTTFKAFQDALLRCFDRVAIVYQNDRPAKVTPRAISSVGR